MVEKCVRCGARENQIKLFDAIYEGKASCICERCSIIENVAILERPSSDKIRESDRIDVYERMKRLSGIHDAKKQVPEERLNRLEELRKNPQLEVPEKKNLELIDHFHWEIMKCRRRKGLSQAQLAQAIGEPEFSIEMIEKGNLGENAESLIPKLEKFFSMRLIKISSLDLLKKEERKTPVLLDEDGNVLELIPEPEVESRNEDLFSDEELEELEDESDSSSDENNNFINKVNGKREKFFTNLLSKFKKNHADDSEMVSSSSFDDEDSRFDENLGLTGEESDEIDEIDEYKDFNLDEVDKEKVKIGDLREWHRKKIDATKNERVEEQKRIEERKKLIEARKEELRLMKERDSKDVDSLLGGTELLKKEVLNASEKNEN